jgi:uncharacterized membrane protein YeiB
MSRSSRARAFLVVGVVCAFASILIATVFLGPLAMLSAAAAIWSGERRAGALLLFAAAGAMALGAYLGARAVRVE